MPSTINTNVASLTAQRNLGVSQSSLQTSIQRLSSGLRINSAKDDAAGLAITDRMTSQVRGLNQASRNANDGISLSQTAEGAMGSISDNLQRIRELAVQSANGTNSSSDRAALQQEVSQLKAEIARVAGQTEFNGLKLLDGSFITQQFQVGANANQVIGVSVDSALATEMGNNKVTSTTGTGISSAALTGAATSAGVNGFVAQVLTISGNGVVKSTPAAGAAGTLAVNSSAKAVAAAVNAFTSETNVTAVATNTATISGVQQAGPVQFQLIGANSTAITVSATVSSITDLGPVAAAINAQTGVTSITAVADKSGNLVLTNSTGDDIKVGNLTTTATGGLIGASIKGADTATSVTFVAATDATNLSVATIGGSVKFNSPTGFTVTSDTYGSLIADAAASGSTLDSVASLDISTTTGANNALLVVDAALSTVSSNRAKLGAVQNRFLTTIQNVNTTAENLSASRSRILDADFAMETANLSRTQILQQAGTAMVAQANQLPQGVLALLRQ